MRSKHFWLAATERAVKSAAQAAILVGFAGSDAINAFSVNWGDVAGFALGGAALSYLTSMVTSGVGEPNDPSAV